MTRSAHRWHDLHWMFDDRPRWQKAAIFGLVVAILVGVRAAIGG